MVASKNYEKGKYSEFVNTDALRRERYSRNISMSEMAKLMGKKSISSYSNLENGLIEPRISEINAVSKILQKSATYFFNLYVQESCT